MWIFFLVKMSEFYLLLPTTPILYLIVLVNSSQTNKSVIHYIWINENRNKKKLIQLEMHVSWCVTVEYVEKYTLSCSFSALSSTAAENLKIKK